MTCDWVEPLEGRTLLSVDPAQAVAPVHVAEQGRYVAEVLTTDLSDDGVPDLVIASGSRVHVHFSRGDGTFERETVLRLRDGLPRRVGRPYADRLFAGDFNGDFQTDLAVTGSTRGPGGRHHPRTWLFLGERDGHHDGRWDLFFADLGRFNQATRSRYGELLVADVDGDGAEDLVTTGMEFVRFDGLRLSEGGPVGGRSWSPYGRPVTGDVDGDGDTDVVGELDEGDGQTVLVRSGDFGPTFEPITGMEGAGTLQLRDLTGDGLPELVRSRWQSVNGMPGLVLEAVPNIAGSLSGPAERVYQETFAEIRARGGHGPDVPSNTEYSASLTLSDVRDLGGDARLDLGVRLESRQTEIGHANPEQFDEVYAFGLIAGATSVGRVLPLYTAGDLPVEGAPPVTRDVVARADFDRDGRPDLVLGRSYTLFPGDDSGGVRAVYVDLGAHERPVALRGGVKGDGPGYGVVGAGGLLSVNARFRRAADSAPALAEAELFLDINRNERLDAGDLRLGRDRTARGNLYEFRVRRDGRWDAAGLGDVALFMVARDESGVLSVPQSGRVQLS